jgi:hypothetical protein
MPPPGNPGNIKSKPNTRDDKQFRRFLCVLWKRNEFLVASFLLRDIFAKYSSPYIGRFLMILKLRNFQDRSSNPINRIQQFLYVSAVILTLYLFMLAGDQIRVEVFCNKIFKNNISVRNVYTIS